MTLPISNMTVGPLVTVGPLGNAFLLHPDGLAAALAGRSVLTDAEHTELAAIAAGLRDAGLLKKTLSSRAPLLESGSEFSPKDRLEAWRSTADLFKQTPVADFRRGVEGAVQNGMAWAFPLGEGAGPARAFYEAHRRRLSDGNDARINPETVIFAFLQPFREEDEAFDPDSEAAFLLMAPLTRNPWREFRDILDFARRRAASTPVWSHFLNRLSGLLADHLPFAETDFQNLLDEEEAPQRGAQLGFLSSLYLADRWLVIAEHNADFFKAIGREQEAMGVHLEATRAELSAARGPRRGQLLYRWRRQFSPFLDPIRVDRESGEVTIERWTPIPDGGYWGTSRSVWVPATDDEVIAALPFHIRGLLGLYFRRLAAQRREMDAFGLNAGMIAFFYRLGVPEEDTAGTVKFLTDGDWRVRFSGSPARKRLGEGIFAVIEAISHAASKAAHYHADREIDNALCLIFQRWYSLMDSLHPEQIPETGGEARRLEEIWRLLGRHWKKIGKRAYLSREAAALLSAPLPWDPESFLQDLRPLSPTGNYFGNFYREEGQPTAKKGGANLAVRKAREERAEARRAARLAEAERLQRERETVAAGEAAEREKIRRREAAEREKLQAENQLRTRTFERDKAEKAAADRRRAERGVMESHRDTMGKLLSRLEDRMLAAVEEGRFPEELLEAPTWQDNGTILLLPPHFRAEMERLIETEAGPTATGNLLNQVRIAMSHF